MKSLIAVGLLVVGVFGINLKGYSQVTDNIVVKSLLGRSIYDTNKILDSLGVWYHQHLFEIPPSQKYIDTRSKVYSISDSKGSVKVYFLRWKENIIIEEIIINFRHDSKEQVEDAGNMIGSSDHHIGYYSTDVVYKLKHR